MEDPPAPEVPPSSAVTASTTQGSSSGGSNSSSNDSNSGNSSTVYGIAGGAGAAAVAGAAAAYYLRSRRPRALGAVASHPAWSDAAAGHGSATPTGAAEEEGEGPIIEGEEDAEGQAEYENAMYEYPVTGGEGMVGGDELDMV